MDWRPGLSECGATVLAVKSMAKRLLIKALTARGCYKESERGIHEKVAMSLRGEFHGGTSSW